MCPHMTTPMDRFIEQMGLLAQAEGEPRIAGQIMGYLVIEGAPRTLQQMTEALQISKASASTNARLLEYKGHVRRVAPMGSRRDAYEAVGLPSIEFIDAMAERFRTAAGDFTGLAADFPASHAAARDRVEELALFYRKSADFFEHWGRAVLREFENATADQKDRSHEQG